MMFCLECNHWVFFNGGVSVIRTHARSRRINQAVNPHHVFENEHKAYEWASRATPSNTEGTK